MKWWLVSLITIGCAQFVSSSFSQVPGIMNYQGRIVDNGTNFTGTGQFQFALVNGTGNLTYWSNDASSSGGSEPIGSVPVTVTMGLYSVLLGDTTLTNMSAIPVTAFTNTDVRLRVWFNDGVTGFQQLSPDQRIAAVGFSLMSANVPDGSITSDKIAAGAVGPSALAVGVMTASDISNNFATASQESTINNLVAAAASTNYVNSTVTGATNALPLGCSILRGTNTIYFGDNITNWSTSIISGDSAFVVGGKYVLTNFCFLWYWQTNTTIEAIGPQIQDIITTGVGFPGGNARVIDMEHSLNCQILGDWNIREIFTSAFCAGAGEDVSLLVIDADANVTVDGFHGQYEVPANGVCYGNAPFVTEMCCVDTNCCIKNAKIGNWFGSPGATTGQAWIGAFDNEPNNTVFFVNDIFYGDEWQAVDNWLGSTIVPFYNCYVLDPNGIITGTALQQLSVMGTIDTNENATYWLPGTPPDVCAVPTNSMKRMPPDCGTFTSLTATSAKISNLVEGTLVCNMFTNSAPSIALGNATNSVVYLDTTVNGITTTFATVNPPSVGQVFTIVNIGWTGNNATIDSGSGHSFTNTGLRYLVLTNGAFVTVQRISTASWGIIGGNALSANVMPNGAISWLSPNGATNYTINTSGIFSHSP